MTIENILVSIRDFLRDVNIDSIGSRVYLSIPKEFNGNFLLIRNLASGKVDFIDEVVNIEIRIVGGTKLVGHVELLEISSKIQEFLEGYNLTLGTFTPYKGVKEMGPIQSEEGIGIKSLICDYKFYFIE